MAEGRAGTTASLPFPGYVFVSAKQGGAHKPDPAGGVYRKVLRRASIAWVPPKTPARDSSSRSGGATYLIKRDGKAPANDIAEFLAGRIFDAVRGRGRPRVSPQISLLMRKGVPYLASRMLDQYRDLHKVAGFRDRPALREHLAALLGRGAYIRKLLQQIHGYAEAIVPSLLVADFSLHSGNLGIVPRSGHPRASLRSSLDAFRLVRVDLGAAFRDPRPRFEAFRRQRRGIFGVEKNYLMRDHPKGRVCSEEFAGEVERVANVRLTAAVRKAWAEIERAFPAEAKEAFIRRFKPTQSELEAYGPAGVIARRLARRQVSMREWTQRGQ
jgi:hypothetical protein